MYLRWSWKRSVSASLLLGLLAIGAKGDELPKSTDLGYKALSEGDWGAALAQFNKVIRDEPNHAEGYYGRAFANWKIGKLDLAIADMSKAIELNPTEATAYRSRGGFYVLKHDCNRVISEALAHRRQNGFDLVDRDCDRAIADCDEAIRLNLKDASTYNNRGYAYLVKGNAQKAIADFTEAIRIDPKFGIAYANRGLAWSQQHDYDRAIADLDESIRIEKTEGAISSRGMVYYFMGKLDKTLADLDEVIRLDPKSTDAYQQRASIYFLQRQIDQAVADLTTAIRLAPESPGAYAGRATCLATQQQYDKAITDINVAIRLSPKSPCYYEERGTLWIERGDYQRGIADIETAIRLNPADPAATFEAWPKALLTAAALQHGERQVRQMLQDRPAMRQYGEEADVLCQWAARKFAGEDLRQKIFWDSSEPFPVFMAENQPPSVEGQGCIRVREKYNDGPDEGKNLCFDELWCRAVFELYNIANADDFGRIVAKVAAGELSRAEFTTSIVECESRAAEKTRSFCIHVVMPWAKEHRVAIHPQSWYLAQRSDANENVFLGFVTGREPHWQHYEHWYNLIVLDTLVRKGENQKAIDLATEMQKHAETKEEQTGGENGTGPILTK